MPETLDPLSDLFDSDDLAAMTLVLDEICTEAPSLGLLKHLPKSSLRPAVGLLIIELQRGNRFSPMDLKSKVLAALKAI